MILPTAQERRVPPPPRPGEAASSAAASICHCLPSGAIWSLVFFFFSHLFFGYFFFIFLELPYFVVAVIFGRAFSVRPFTRDTIFLEHRQT